MSSSDKKGRRRFITRGEAVDVPHYDQPEPPGDGQRPVNATPPTPPRQPPQTPPGHRTRRRFERSPGSLSPSAASSRRRFSPSGSPSAPSRASTLSTASQHPVQADMNRYGVFGRDVAPPGVGTSTGRSMTAEGAAGYKHYPSYRDSRLAELDPTRSSSHRNCRRDSSSSESSIHGSLVSLYSDGSLRESTPSYHENLLTPPRSPTDKLHSRTVANRPRSWYDTQQLQGQGHLSSESPTGFPFAASSYENLDKEGSGEKALPRSNTLGAIGAMNKDNLSHLVHARSFAGHEGGDNLSPNPSGLSPFTVAKHFPRGKPSSWQPPRLRSSDPGSERMAFAVDSNVRRYLPEVATSQTQGNRGSPLMKIPSAESDASSVASMPVGTKRTTSGDIQEVTSGTRWPTSNHFARDRSFDSSISEPASLKTDVATHDGEYTQHAPCKARPFGNHSQTVELSQIQRSAQGPPSTKSGQKAMPSMSSSVKEQAKKFEARPDVVCPPCGIPVMPSGGITNTDTAYHPVGSYKSATMPGRLLDSGDKDRRPSLPEQGEQNVLYKEQRLKELSVLPSFGGSQPKRSQSLDVTGKKSLLFRSEAPSIGQDDMLMSVTGRTKPMMSSQMTVMSSAPAVIQSKSGSFPSPTAKSIMSIHRPSPLPTVAETLPSSSTSQDRDIKQTASVKSSELQAAETLSPPPTVFTSPSSSPELRSVDLAQLSGEASPTKTVAMDSDQSAFKPFVKDGSVQQHGDLSAGSTPSVCTVGSPLPEDRPVAAGIPSTAISVSKSSLLSVKSPTMSSHTSMSQSPQGSLSASPRLSPRPLELCATKQPSPTERCSSPLVGDDMGNPEIKRGISQESIQSAMAVLDDAIAMLNSVAMDKSTVTMTTATITAASAAATGSIDSGIDLSRSGLLKYSFHGSAAKPLSTDHYSKLPLPTCTHSSIAVPAISSTAVPYTNPPNLISSVLLHNKQNNAVTQLTSSVQTVMSTTKPVSSIPPEAASVPNIVMSPLPVLPITEEGDNKLRLADDGAVEAGDQECGISKDDVAGNVVKDHMTQDVDTSHLDQILASMQQEESQLGISAIKTGQPPGVISLDSETRSRQKYKEKPTDRDKSLEEIEARRTLLIREDSFNRSDSDPDVSCMPLPRDSVILRHRYHIKEDLSSSSDSSSPATPRLSPRVMRRHRKPGSDSSSIGDGKKRKHLNVPGRHNAEVHIPDLLLLGGGKLKKRKEKVPRCRPSTKKMLTGKRFHPLDMSVCLPVSQTTPHNRVILPLYLVWLEQACHSVPRHALI